MAEVTDRKKAAMARQRRILLWAAATMLPFFAEDLLSGHKNAHWLIGVKAVWGLVLLMVALGFSRAGPAQHQLLLAISAFVSGPLMAAIAALHGGHDAPHFAWLFALPFCVVALVQDEVPAATISALTSTAGAAVILGMDGVGGVELVQWLLCLGTSGGMAVYASVHLRRFTRAQDLTLERLAEAERRTAHAERMATIGTLAAGVAHEINNPLASVTANLDFLAQELQAPSSAPDEVELVVLETEMGLKRIKGIVGNLTAFSREGTAGNTEVDLRAVVDEAERLAAQRTGHQIGIQNELPANLRKVMGNQRHLAQVILNLLINSADAITGAKRSDGLIWIRASTNGNDVKVDIEDNGPGLSEPVLKGLFVPFFTTKAPRGVGLSLATSREYLRRAGGDLTAAQRPEGGARFTIALRAAPA